jgi:Na+-transporting NADH:ubiquinone oxidoreductase subunit B
MSETGRSLVWQASIGLLSRLGSSAHRKTSGTLHIRHSANTDRLLAAFIFASLPAALLGAWRVGSNRLAAFNDVLTPVDWRIETLAAIGIGEAPTDVGASLLLGLMYTIPLLVVVLAASAAWEIVFSSVRRRASDPGWPMASWLFILLIPHQTPLILAAVGISFGAVFGQHIFGGTGRYVASPAVLGALFLHFAYPSLSDTATTWSMLADLSWNNTTDESISWWAVFFNQETGSLGTTSALACAVGAIWLAVARLVSLRTLAGAIVGLVSAVSISALFSSPLPAHWHFALGSFAFCWAFVLTDPTTLPLTRAGRWIHGALFGLLVVLIREADPARPEATLSAVLLASLFVPVIDFVVLRVQSAQSNGRLVVET